MAAPPPPPPLPPITSPSESDDDEKDTNSASSYSESDSDATPIPTSIPFPPPPPPAPPSVPVTGADVVTEQAEAPVKDDRKLWERPWSLKELRGATNTWTLAADAGLLLYMKEFSQRVVSKTTEIEKQVDSLIHEAKNTDTRAGNIFNDFVMLSNIQFVENRVYEESNEDEGKEKEEAQQGQSEERPAEEKQREVFGKIREAVSCGLKVLDEAFTKLEVQEEASSDSDDEAVSGYHEPLLEPKDPYALRPMPFLIGTGGFFSAEDVGIGELPTDSEEEEEEDEYSSDEESPPPRQQTKGLMEEGSSDELFEKSDRETDDEGLTKPKGLAEEGSGTSSSGESSSDGVFGSDDDEGTSKKPAVPGQVDFQAELAAKLGVGSAVPAAEGSDLESSVAPSESVSATGGRKKKKRKKKHKDKGLAEEEDIEKSISKPKEGGLFMPEEDEDEGTPFGQGDNIFGSSKTAKGLFDNSDDEEKETSGLFSGQKSKEETAEDVEEASTQSVTSSKATKKKLPAGAVSIFGSAGLFSPEEEKSVTFDDQSTVISEGSPSVTKKKDVSSLFDEEDDDEEGGIFSTTKKTTSSGLKQSPTTAPKPRRQKSSSNSSDIFDDKDGGLFGESPPNVAASPSRKKKPVGGVAIFGVQPSMLKESLKSKSSVTEEASTPEEPTPSEVVSTVKTTTTSKNASGGGGLFNESEGEEDLFSTLAATKPKAKGKPPVGGVSVFGGVTDELIGATSTQPDTSSTPPAPSKPAVTSTVPPSKSAGLFSDSTESDDDGGLFSSKPITTSAPKATSTQTAKPAAKTSKDPFSSIMDSEEEGDDLFSAVKPSSTTKTQTVKAVEPTPAQASTTTKPKATSTQKGPFGLSVESDDDDGDNLFASALTSKASTIEKKQQTKPQEKTTTTAKTATTASGKKKPVARLGGLFDQGDDDDEDLFGTSNFGLGFSKPSTAKTTEQPAKTSKPTLDLLSDSHSEEDADLFTTKPKPVKQPKATSPPPTMPKTKQTDELFTTSTDGGSGIKEPDTDVVEPAKPAKKKPAGAVSMFGGVDLFGGKVGGGSKSPTSPVVAEEKPQESVPVVVPEEKTKKAATVGGLFGSPTSEDDDIFSIKPKKAPVKPPVAVPQPKPEDDDDLFSTVKPSKLKSSISFDPATMKPPSATKAPVTEKSVSFDNPKTADTLASLTKNRATRKGGRRPPSRHAVKAQSSQSEDTIAEFTAGMTSPQSPSKPLGTDLLSLGGGGDNDDLFAASSKVLTPTTKKKVKKPVATPTTIKQPADTTKDILFGNDDLLAESPPKPTAGVLSAPSVTVDQTRTTEIEKQLQKELQEEDDLFSSKVLSKPTTAVSDELFGAATSTKDVTDVHSQKPDDDDDELFPTEAKKKPKKTKSTDKKKKPTVTDEDLFGNTDDIFGDVPKTASKSATGKSTTTKSGKGKKKKKSSKATATTTTTTTTTADEPTAVVPDVIDASKLVTTTETIAPTSETPATTEKKSDDVEDLFGDASPKPKKAKTVKKAKKKPTTPKDYSMFDTDAPSIFDDPLNADQ